MPDRCPGEVQVGVEFERIAVRGALHAFGIGSYIRPFSDLHFLDAFKRLIVLAERRGSSSACPHSRSPNSRERRHVLQCQVTAENKPLSRVRIGNSAIRLSYRHLPVLEHGRRSVQIGNPGNWLVEGDPWAFNKRGWCGFSR